MFENKEYYVRSRSKKYLLPFLIPLCLIQLPAIYFRFKGNYPNIDAVIVILSTLMFSILIIVGYMIFLGHISKKQKTIEVSNGYVFCGANKIHVSEIKTVELLPKSGIAIKSGSQTLESFHLTNNSEIMNDIFEQKKIFVNEM